MVFRRALAGAALLWAAGCAPDAPERDTTAVGDTPLAGAKPVAPQTPSAPPGVALPPADAERRYVGRWASRADLCEGGAWVFTRDHFGMEDGPMCDFTDVSEIPGGFRIEAQCEAPRGEQSRTIFTIRFAESARAMTVEDLATLPDTGLVYCGPA